MKKVLSSEGLFTVKISYLHKAYLGCIKSIAMNHYISEIFSYKSKGVTIGYLFLNQRNPACKVYIYFFRAKTLLKMIIHKLFKHSVW